MASEIDWQSIQTAQMMLALHQGSADLARIGQHEISYDASTATSATVDAKTRDASSDATDGKKPFEETRKAEAIKAYLARKS